MKDDLEDSKEIAEQATYEDEAATSKRTVTIPLKEYDEIKREEHFINSQTLIDFIDNRNYEVLLGVTNDVGCYSEIIRTISIYPEYTIYVPNAFTPNGDGENDIFLAQANGINYFEMLIIDWWGSFIFTSNQYFFLKLFRSCFLFLFYRY